MESSAHRDRGLADDSGNAEALTSAATGAVTEAEDLAFQSATVDGVTLTITFIEALDTGQTPDTSAFAVTVAGNLAASFTGQAVTNTTPAAIQLTASASSVPSSHDGSGAFTFELRFSEEPKDDFSYTTMKNHAFTVSGGTVTKASRLAPPSNVGWEITVTPDGDGTVTIVLPVTTDCAADGAICTEDGRMLSAELEITVPGPGG